MPSRRDLLGWLGAAPFFLPLTTGTAAAAAEMHPASPGAFPSAGLDEAATVTRIAFGSCLDQTKPQPIWDAVADAAPQLFVFLGDNVYADATDRYTLVRAYSGLGAQAGYARLRRDTHVMATWDDHDYGVNDSGAGNPIKRESREVFLEFFDEPADSPRWTQPGGIYTSRIFGPPGRRVQVILLDTRWSRSPWVAAPEATWDRRIKLMMGKYLSVPSGARHILGEEQWDWLEARLREPAELRLIGSSIQFAAAHHGFEAWANFPSSQLRLMKLIEQVRAEGVVFLSGDRHFAELSRMGGAPGYPLYDLTSSSMNRPSPRASLNGSRIGEPVLSTANFGLLLIDWDKPTPRVTLQIRDPEGTVRLEHGLSLSELTLGN